jgi:REP element-mobilizing transposase RayT
MRRAGTAVYVHIVWATWGGLPLLVDDVAFQVRQAIGARCQEMGVEVVALGGVEDHVHLLVKLAPTVALAELVKQVKGASWHMVIHAYPHNGDFFKWRDSFGAVSIAPGALHEVAEYIKNQPTVHAAHYLNPDWEPPTVDEATGE